MWKLTLSLFSFYCNSYPIIWIVCCLIWYELIYLITSSVYTPTRYLSAFNVCFRSLDIFADTWIGKGVSSLFSSRSKLSDSFLHLSLWHLSEEKRSRKWSSADATDTQKTTELGYAARQNTLMIERENCNSRLNCCLLLDIFIESIRCGCRVGFITCKNVTTARD